MTLDHSVVSSIEWEQHLDRLGGAPQARAAAVLPQANSIDAIAARMLAHDRQCLFKQSIPAALVELSLNPALKRLTRNPVRVSPCA